MCAWTEGKLSAGKTFGVGRSTTLRGNGESFSFFQTVGFDLAISRGVVGGSPLTSSGAVRQSLVVRSSELNARGFRKSGRKF